MAATRRFLAGRIGRRLAAALALVGYLFAVTIGAAAHCQAMMLTALPQTTVAQHHAQDSGRDGGASAHAAHAHHHAPSADDDTPDAPSKLPSALACGLCQSCSPCGLVVLQSGGDSVRFAYQIRYLTVALSAPGGHIGDLPAEPPRA